MLIRARLPGLATSAAHTTHRSARTRTHAALAHCARVYAPTSACMLGHLTLPTHTTTWSSCARESPLLASAQVLRGMGVGGRGPRGRQRPAARAPSRFRMGLRRCALSAAQVRRRAQLHSRRAVVPLPRGTVSCRGIMSWSKIDHGCCRSTLMVDIWRGTRTARSCIP